MTLFSHERNIGSPVVCQPINLEEAVSLKKTYGASACYVSGGTLLRTQWESGLLPMPDYLISLDNIRDLNGIEYELEHDISIGSRTLLKDCCKHPILEGGG
ncbi:CO/xanthine dehydrogenase FAD-binding subunit [Paenibacillus sp. DS2015]|uniref:FAD binding domain-containing protein n=1 Tax=Paenibacillus sp. DS2015 TaxID=3373917 RepID=UPI003D254016